MKSPLLPDAGSPMYPGQFELACQWAARWLPGLVLTLVLAMAGYFLSLRVGGSAFIYALLLGLLCQPLARQPEAAAGLTIAPRLLLPAGIALMGLQISVADLQGLGWQLFALLALALAASLVLGFIIARLLGLDKEHAAISASAVAICGASAAVAVSSVLPGSRNNSARLAATVTGITALSALAMLLYPLLVQSLGLSDTAGAVFLGASIHDVAQVVAAGYTLSPQAGETATLVKLARVAMLVPVVALTCVLSGGRGQNGSAIKIPVFLYVFVALMAINSILYLPPAFAAFASELSFWCILTAVAAAGVKTSLVEIMRIGARPVWVMILQSLLVATIAMVLVLGYEGVAG